MKYFKRAKIYKISNCIFDPESMVAWSYGWWKFVALIEGKIIFNNHSYSQSTIKHQYKVRRVMSELGIKIDLDVPVPQGLQGMDTLAELYVVAEEALCNEFLRDEERKISKNERAAIRRQRAKDSARDLVVKTFMVTPLTLLPAVEA